MKKALVIILLFYQHILLGQEQDKTSVYANLEVGKAFAWVTEGSIYFAPNVTIYRPGFSATLLVGWVNIDSEIYQEMLYSNIGYFTKMSASLRLASFGSTNYVDGLYVGFGMGVSDFDEEGSVTFEGNYFDDYQVELTQSNRLLMFSYTTSVRTTLTKKWMFTAGLELSYIATEYDQPHYPVYYVPGSGIVNLFGDSADNESVTFSFSLTFGYKIK
ncbi:MAG: hypothetical protein AAGA02_06670 [Bacteroidota bacterium]